MCSATQSMPVPPVDSHAPSRNWASYGILVGKWAPAFAGVTVWVSAADLPLDALRLVFPRQSGHPSRESFAAVTPTANLPLACAAAQTISPAGGAC